MSWAVVAVTPVVWISGGWALSLVALLLVCMNCWTTGRGGLITHRPVQMHQSSVLTSREESRACLPPPVGDPGILDHDNDDEDFEEAPPPIPAPSKSPSVGAQGKTKKSITDAESHGSYVNIQTDYVNIHHSAQDSSPVNEALYLKVLPAGVQEERSQANHSYENVATMDEFKASVDSLSGFDYENVMGPRSL